ncbi:MAG: FKBP-type peptidyl-prolyl cis-trans isomerase [Steroidobacteraceae bacterium]
MHSLNARWLSRVVALAPLLVAAPAVLAQTPAPATAPPAAASPAALAAEPLPDDAASYSVGLAFGSQLHASGLEHGVSLEAVTRGLKEGLAGKPFGADDRERAMQLFRSGRDAIAAHNRSAARDFLAKNGQVKGVTTTASGLQYQVIEAGDAKAASPTVNDRVTVHYRGRLLDGTEFDSSDAHAQAATFGVNGVIKGWREALLLMKPAAKWRLFIPPELAYDNASPPSIPPGSLLIFDVELLRIEPPAALNGPGVNGPAGAKAPRAKRPAPSTPGQ